MNAEFDLAAERRKAERLLAELKKQRGKALLDGQPFNGARITEAEAALEAIVEAEGEAGRRLSAAEADARQRGLAEKVASRHEVRERYLAAIEKAQKACGAYVAALRIAVDLGGELIEADGVLERLAPQLRPAGFRTTPTHDRDAIIGRAWSCLKPALREGLETVWFGGIDLSRLAGEPKTSEDWRDLEVALDAGADRAADRALMP